MVEDLKQQAAELYKERNQQEIPTSDSLSMRKVVYASLGILLLLVLVIQVFGGFKPRQDPIRAATTPPPLVKEAPPPELLEGEKTQPFHSPSAPSAPKPLAALPAETPPPAQPELATPPVAETNLLPTEGERSAASNRPTLKREGKSASALGKRATAPSKKTSATGTKTTEPPLPVVNPIEVARQELAKDLVLEKSPALKKLIASPDPNSEYKGWSAESDGPDSYKVSFTFLDKASGSTILYVWQVNITARSVTPLSYYARKLV